MFVLRVKLSKRRIFLCLLCVLAVVLTAVLFVSAGNPRKIKGEDFGDRMAYVYSLGLKIEDGETKKSITVPESFSKAYKEYNEIQKKSGFDLSNYKGKNGYLYTYKLLDNNKNLELTVINGKIVGANFSWDSGGKTAPVN